MDAKIKNELNAIINKILDKNTTYEQTPELVSKFLAIGSKNKIPMNELDNILIPAKKKSLESVIGMDTKFTNLTINHENTGKLCRIYYYKNSRLNRVDGFYYKNKRDINEQLQFMNCNKDNSIGMVLEHVIKYDDIDINLQNIAHNPSFMSKVLYKNKVIYTDIEEILE